MNKNTRNLTGQYIKEMMENCFKLEMDARRFFYKMKIYRRKYFIMKKENRLLKDQIEMLKKQIN